MIDPIPLQKLLNEEQADILLTEVMKLPHNQRTIIIAMMNGVSLIEYAALTGKYIRTLDNNYCNACKNLRKALQAYKDTL